MDVAIIDTPWNGLAESLKIATMADAYEVNVAPHNFYSHLATMMSATSRPSCPTCGSWRSTRTTCPGRTTS